MFDRVVFQPAHTPIYSSSTAQPFPADPVAIRRLTVGHWAAPVEFTRMIETMYAEGVRLFVEAGPRGNLSAFVEDILRGRPVAAIPANVQRRSGIAQFNHLAGQLAAHHVPLHLDYFYARRDPQTILWEKSQCVPSGIVKEEDQRDARRESRLDPPPASSRPFHSEGEPVTRPAASTSAASPPTSKEFRPSVIAAEMKQPNGNPVLAAEACASPKAPRSSEGPAPLSNRAAVLSQYWTVMEQFLDIQQGVMEQFLATRRAGSEVASVAAKSLISPALPAEQPAQGIAAPATPQGGDPISPRVVSAHPALPAFPLMGEILRHEAGRELVMRRKLDLQEDLFAAHHTLGGRNASKVDPEQHGQPVMPMTFSLEMMAEASVHLVPGKVVVGLRNIRLLRWLPFDDEEPITVEVTARVLAEASVEPPDRVQVAASIRDMGNAKWVAVEGTVLLADRYPEPPAVEAFPLKHEVPCPISTEDLYRNLFHGPLFQGVLSTGRIGDEGTEGQVTVLPRSGLFRSVAEPTPIMDPVLLDVAMHLAASWHLYQPDQAGRTLLPYELKGVELYGPSPPVGSLMTSRVRTEQSTSRYFKHGVDLIGADGRFWCRLMSAGYWRFYVPFGDVNYHGPMDQYFLSKDWPLALATPDGQSRETAAGSEPADPVHAWCMRLDPPTNLVEPVMRSATARVALSRSEFQQFRALKGPEQRINQWLFGRLAAKDAVRTLWRHRHGERLFPADIEIEPDAHGRPMAPAGFGGAGRVPGRFHRPHRRGDGWTGRVPSLCGD